ARSTASGISRTLRYDRIPWTLVAFGFTGYTVPWYLFTIRLCRISYPIFPRLRDAPTIAMDDGEKIASSPVRGTAAPNPRRGLKVLASSRRRPLSRFEVAIMHDNGAIWVIYRGGEQGRHWAGEIPCPGAAVPHAPPPVVVLHQERGDCFRRARLRRRHLVSHRSDHERHDLCPRDHQRAHDLGRRSRHQLHGNRSAHDSSFGGPHNHAWNDSEVRSWRPPLRRGEADGRWDPGQTHYLHRKQHRVAVSMGRHSVQCELVRIRLLVDLRPSRPRDHGDRQLSEHHQQHDSPSGGRFRL